MSGPCVRPDGCVTPPACHIARLTNGIACLDAGNPGVDPAVPPPPSGVGSDMRSRLADMADALDDPSVESHLLAKSVAAEHAADIRAILSLLSSPSVGLGVPADVAELVVAARIVAFEDQSPEAIQRLDTASEAFASRVPWDEEPDEVPPALPGEG